VVLTASLFIKEPYYNICNNILTHCRGNVWNGEDLQQTTTYYNSWMWWKILATKARVPPLLPSQWIQISVWKFHLNYWHLILLLSKDISNTTKQISRHTPLIWWQRIFI
jgi:hypothetical protein